MSGLARIRKATEGDVEAIGVLWKEFMDFHKEHDRHFSRSSSGHERFREFIGGHVSADGSCVLVAEMDRAVVGYCLATLAKYPPVFENEDYGSVFDLAVTERWRRMGIGERLYRAAEAWFADRGVGRIELRLAVSNEVSTAFWKKMGFTPYVTTVFKDI